MPVSITVPTSSGPVTEAFTDTKGSFALTGSRDGQPLQHRLRDGRLRLLDADAHERERRQHAPLASGTLTTLALNVTNVFVGDRRHRLPGQSGDVVLAELTSS